MNYDGHKLIRKLKNPNTMNGNKQKRMSLGGRYKPFSIRLINILVIQSHESGKSLSLDDERPSSHPHKHLLYIHSGLKQ